MPQINDIELLRPDIRAILAQHRIEAKNKGIVIVCVETLRTADVQLAYYMQGREPLTKVNAQRAKAGLHLISDAENKRIITNAKTSDFHGTGRAYDIAPGRYVNGVLVPWWGAPWSVWQELGEIGERLGMTWGGRWKKLNDCPHFQKD